MANKPVKSRNTRKPTNRKTNKNTNKQSKPDALIYSEIVVWCLLAACILLMISSFGVGGFIGDYIAKINFGIFGLLGYVSPIIIFFIVTSIYLKHTDMSLMLRLGITVLAIIFILTLIQLVTTPYSPNMKWLEYYTQASEGKNGGGLLGGTIVKILCPAIGVIGTVILSFITFIITFVMISRQSVFKALHTGQSRVRREYQERRAARPVKREWKNVTFNSTVSENKFGGEPFANPVLEEKKDIRSESIEMVPPIEEKVVENPPVEEVQAEKIPRQRKAKNLGAEEKEKETAEIIHDIEQQQPTDGSYIFPSVSLLNQVKENKSNATNELQETAVKLQQTLKSFGVNVQITDYSQGPSVTRYELQPESGVKVSRIVGLADDIKLNLAAADIRIEAPIPGKAAVGIEVPNKENAMVSLRSLLESKEFRGHESNLAFAAGKDIGGKTIVTDIAKMPHLLIAGSTGSGKSVCINTLIMSILYKANPDDVKLIMIDPKVVELSVYNGIPHLLIPVVTDPKKAAGALNWAVVEMTKRYQLFAEYNVRDLKGYNKKVESIEEIEDENKPQKMPQIVVIVDELADLMMVAPGDVEDSICRLAQLARAAGIHLIIATQRPSVNVITGLIKANMPSRIAFAVSSGVDSRTIIDMNGAEKLLGKGDMLFYPQGYSKPARVQGAFVSDAEVHSVVEFLTSQCKEVTYNEDIENHVSNAATTSGNSGASGGDGGSTNELDVHFVDAGKFIIEKDKASIGMLQRSFKIGFNRAARIMEQLCDAGVVGEEEGTKPRKILMSMEEFLNFIENEM